MRAFRYVDDEENVLEWIRERQEGSYEEPKPAPDPVRRSVEKRMKVFKEGRPL